MNLLWRAAYYRKGWMLSSLVDRDRQPSLGVDNLMRFLYEEQALFEWQFGARHSGMAG